MVRPTGSRRFRPADVACLLSASNRRADIVRATPIRSSTESRRAVQKLGGESTYRRDGSGSRKQTRASANVSSKPIARVAPGLRTKTFAGDQSWPVQPSGPASYRATGERRLYRAKSGGKPAISIRKASQEGENRADGLTARRCVNDTGSPSLPVSRTIRNRRDCLTLSPRPPDQSGDPASSYRIGAVFLTGR